MLKYCELRRSLDRKLIEEDLVKIRRVQKDRSMRVGIMRDLPSRRWTDRSRGERVGNECFMIWWNNKERDPVKREQLMIWWNHIKQGSVIERERIERERIERERIERNI